MMREEVEYPQRSQLPLVLANDAATSYRGSNGLTELFGSRKQFHLKAECRLAGQSFELLKQVKIDAVSTLKRGLRKASFRQNLTAV